MRSFGKILIAVLIFWLWMNIATHYYLCEMKNICGGNELDNEAIAISKIPNTLLVKADGIVVLENYPEFVFVENVDTTRIYKKHSDFLAQLSAMLKAQPNARLLVKGRYRSSENETIGSKRAKFIIEKLVRIYSISETSVLHSVEIGSDSAGLGFELLGYMPKTELLIAREDSIIEKQCRDSFTKVSYNGILATFEPNLSEFKSSTGFNKYCDSLRQHLKSRPNARIQIIGFCDSHIPDAEADKTALQFANLTAEYLKKSGVKNIISTSSKGKKELVKSDRLPDQSPDVLAIAKNRRVEILITESATKPKNKNLKSKNK